MDEDDIAMTSYFRPIVTKDTPIPEDFPWNNWAEFEKDLEDVMDYMKGEGVRLGHLEVTPEGYLKGRGHPDTWFDSIDMSNFNPNGKD